MADTQSTVYSFEGNVSSLKQATETAIGLLSKYEKAIQSANNEGTFSTSQRAASSFNTALSKMEKTITSVQKELTAVGDVNLFSDSSTAKTFTNTLSTLQQQLTSLSSADVTTTKTLNAMKAELNSTRQAVANTTPEVAALVAKEQQFQSTLAGAESRIYTAAAAINNMAASISGNLANAITPITSKVSSMSTSFKTAFDGMTAKLTSFKEKATQASSRVTTFASTVSSAFRRVLSSSSDMDAASNSSTTFLQKLASSWSSLSSKLTSASQSISNITSGLKTLTSKLKTTSTQTDNSSSSFKLFDGFLGNATDDMTSLGTSSTTVTTIMNALKTAVAGLVAINLSEWLKSVTEASIDYVETLNLFEVALSDNLEVAYDFVDAMSEVYGMDPESIMSSVGYFYLLAEAIDMPTEAATTLSTGLTKAANDIASLFNTDVDTVIENLSSGLQGYSRAVDKYGIDIRATTLQTKALELGITESTDSMSEANLQVLRYIVMMEQTSSATQQLVETVDGATDTVGDFANTIETPANQLRIFQEQISQLARAIGDFFTPTVTAVLPYINGFVMALRMAITYLGVFLGITSSTSSTSFTSDMEDEADAIASVGEAAEDTADSVSATLAPFDELNALSSSSSSDDDSTVGTDDSGIYTALLDAMNELDMTIDDVSLKANALRDTFLEFFGFTTEDGEIFSWSADTFESNLIDKFPEWTKTIETLFDNWGSIVSSFESIFKSVGNIIVGVFDNIKSAIDKFVNDDSMSSYIVGLVTSLESFSSWLSASEEPIANLITGLLLIGAALALLSTITPIVTALASFTSYLVGLLNPITLVLAILALLYFSCETFAAGMNDLIASVISGFSTVLAEFVGTLAIIGASLASTWSESVMPMLDAVGTALTPVLESLRVVWEALVSILISSLQLIAELWTSTVAPVLAAFMDAIAALAVVFQNLWENVVGPIISNLAAEFTSLWQTSLEPLFASFVEALGALALLILALWSNVLMPLLSWIIQSFGPSIAAIVNTIVSVFVGLFNSISGVVTSLLSILTGIITFLVGVFTGDWELAWKGILNILIGILNTVITVFTAVVNVIIALINSLTSLIYSAILALVNMIIASVSGIASTLGYSISVGTASSVPKISYVTAPTISTYADGGFVSTGQLFIARESGPEMVGNIGGSTAVANNDQITQAISAAVYEAVVAALATGSSSPTVIVTLDENALGKASVNYIKSVRIKTGTNPVLV